MKICLYFVFFFLCFDSYSQIKVYSTREINKQKINKTIFIYRNEDKDRLKDLKTLLSEHWKYTNNLVLMDVDEYLDYEMQSGDLVFIFSYNLLSSQSSSGATSNFVDFYLMLSQKKGEEFMTLGEANISVTGPSIVDVCNYRKSQGEIIYDLYTEKEVFSWNDAYLATIMHTFSDNLEQGSLYETANKVTSKDVGFLKNKKLFVMDEVQSVQNRFTGKETEKDFQEMFERHYDFDFKLVNKDFINEKVKEEPEGYVLMFQKVGFGKAIIILNLSNFEIVYYKMTNYSYSFSKEDIITLNKEILKN